MVSAPQQKKDRTPGKLEQLAQWWDATPYAPTVSRWIRFWTAVSKGFWENKCQSRASALAYTTLLALVPLMAVSLSVATLVFDARKDESRQTLTRMIEEFVQSVAPALGLEDAEAPPAPGAPAGPNALTPTNRPQLAPTAATPPNRPNSPRTNTPTPLRPSAISATNAPPTAPAAVAPAPAAPSRSQVKRQEVAQQLVEAINRINFGTIGVTAIIGLIFVAIGLLRTIEASLNDIWSIKKGRGWFQSTILYWAAITLGPIVLLMATTSGYLNSLESTQVWFLKLPGGSFILRLASLGPVALLAVTFGALYFLMPNTRVEWRAALVGGLVAAILWWLNNKLGALYNTRVLTASRIYGSLGAIPLFLAGLYLSWLILLFGAQTAYVYQNRKSYLQDHASAELNQQDQEFFGLLLLVEIGRRFSTQQPPASSDLLADTLLIPRRLAATLLGSLRQAGLVVELAGPTPAFTPAKPLHQISAESVLRWLRASTRFEPPPPPSPHLDPVRRVFLEIVHAERNKAGQITLDSLVQESLAAPLHAAPVRSEHRAPQPRA